MQRPFSHLDNAILGIVGEDNLCNSPALGWILPLSAFLESEVFATILLSPKKKKVPPLPLVAGAKVFANKNRL